MMDKRAAEINKLVREASGKPCILCGKPPVMTGLFTPDEEHQDEFCTPPGKTRFMAYTLCRKHAGRRKPSDKTVDAVERKMAARCRELERHKKFDQN